MTAPALYWHYQDKDALLRDMGREVAAIYRDHVYSPLHEVGGLPRLRSVLEAFRTFAVSEPNYYEVLFLIPPLAGSPLRPGSMLQVLVDRVRDCMRANELREGDPADVALTIAAHAQGAVMLYRRGRFDSEAGFAEFFDRSMERLLSGIAAG